MLEAREIGSRIEGRVLWQHLSFSLEAGERLGISGPSGSGKTVLMRTLAGLAPLQEGNILLEGKPQSQWHMPTYRARVVYLAQRPALPEGTVEAALRAPFRFHVHAGQGLPRTRLDEYLGLLELGSEFLGQRTDNLSGGESQLAAALRALLPAPRILLLDEPTASLDAEAVNRMEALIQRWLSSEAGRACLWTSHDQSQLERMTDRVLTLNSTRQRRRA